MKMECQSTSRKRKSKVKVDVMNGAVDSNANMMDPLKNSCLKSHKNHEEGKFKNKGTDSDEKKNRKGRKSSSRERKSKVKVDDMENKLENGSPFPKEKKMKRKSKSHRSIKEDCEKEKSCPEEQTRERATEMKVKSTSRKRKSYETVEDIAKNVDSNINIMNQRESDCRKVSKKVRFAENVQVMNICENANVADKSEDLVRGKRFTPEEDELVKKAVLDYIDAHNLGDEGINMVMNCQRHPQIRTCWKEIGGALPHRPQLSVYSRAHIIFERDSNRHWTPEEFEFVKKFYNEHGPKWKKLAEIMGKQRLHIKDCWRRIKNDNKKSGKWEQEEYQTLFDLVNLDLQSKVSFGKKHSKHGMLRDDIPWTAISEKMKTRNQDISCMKWYRQLTSPMVSDGKWCDSDDYRLVKALHEANACCIEDVDWDELIENRSGDVCRHRWMQIVKHLGEHRKKPFEEQVKVLTLRYCPSLLPTRLAFENLPLAD